MTRWAAAAALMLVAGCSAAGDGPLAMSVAPDLDIAADAPTAAAPRLAPELTETPTADMLAGGFYAHGLGLLTADHTSRAIAMSRTVTLPTEGLDADERAALEVAAATASALFGFSFHVVDAPTPDAVVVEPGRDPASDTCAGRASGVCWIAQAGCLTAGQAAFTDDDISIRPCTASRLAFSAANAYAFADQTGLARETVLTGLLVHELGHLAGLAHRDGTIMQALVHIVQMQAPSLNACQRAMLDAFEPDSASTWTVLHVAACD